MTMQMRWVTLYRKSSYQIGFTILYIILLELKLDTE